MIVPHLETILCDTDDARDFHYRLRYRVFCKQTGFEQADNFPNRRETDGYDETATHFLVLDRLRQRWVGAMRLIHGREGPLPIEDICKRKVEGLNECRANSVEMSRLSVVNDRSDADLAASYLGGNRSLVTSVETGRESCSHARHEPLVRMVWAAVQWGNQGRHTPGLWSGHGSPCPGSQTLGGTCDRCRYGGSPSGGAQTLGNSRRKIYPPHLSFRSSSALCKPLHSTLCAGFHALNTNENPA
jgi:hypothetical protein